MDHWVDINWYFFLQLRRMGPERLSNLFKVTQLVRNTVKLPALKPTLFSLISAAENLSFLQLHWGGRWRAVRWWGELAGGIVLSFFHNYLGAERQRESEQVPEELTLKATSPEEPRASGPLSSVAYISTAIISGPLTTLSEVPSVIIKTGSGLWLWKRLEPPRAGSYPC